MKAVFRLPFSEQFLCTEHTNGGRNLVQFTSFDGEKHIDFSAENFEILDEKSLQKKLKLPFHLTSFNEGKQMPSQKEYLEKINTAVKIVKESKIPKLVISRPILKETPQINLAETYLNLCEKYQNTLCYLLMSEKEVWMGATPEILGKFNRETKEFFTMSLAGTLPLDEEWSDKEIEEQKPVTDYISGILKNFSEDISQSETYTHISGNIKHLRTDFTAKIDEKDLENLISELHPTPAVCGIPKEFCKQKILELEEYDRELYSGIIKLETEKETFYFVNLRCAKLYQNHIVAFAGGGITAKSSPEKEWRETELKSGAIFHNLKF